MDAKTQDIPQLQTDSGTTPESDAQSDARSSDVTHDDESTPVAPKRESLQPLLPADHLERVYGWGMSISAAGYVFRPSTIDAVPDIFELAAQTGRTVCIRGSGRSYGDAAINGENIILDVTRLKRVLDWNPATGVITVEPGVTIADLWQYVLPDGWWPPVVPGTMYPTLSGCASMNVHGKNQFALGSIGEHILEFTLLTPTGETLRCSRTENEEFFRAAIGGFGMLGCFTSITLRMKRVWSGDLEVESINAATLADMFRIFREREEAADYLVGWIDTFPKGDNLGRGVIHQANYLDPGVDQNPAQTLRLDHQQLPDTILGILPKSILYKFMRPFMNNLGMRLINIGRFRSSKLIDRGKTYRQSHAAFAFLLDYVPNWKRSYGKEGLIQYQSFVPKEEAERVFGELLRLCAKRGLPSYLAVLKRHRADSFLMTHSVDGYSLALDFKITRRNREKVWKLAAEMNGIVLDAGGKFYFAKDSTLTPEAVRRYLGAEALDAFSALKKRYDPNGMLESALSRRLFGAFESDRSEATGSDGTETT